ncbi:MAG: inosine/xanthosine triphosphatase [Candidatus Roizmanbacteria bacterium]|nr:inosine/xanthosine triphosphatase [Candidatus Roizmanbacteria bacterium]
MHVVVASTNPVKITAVQRSFSQVFSRDKVITKGVSVASGVSEQPRSNTETLRGARNRARAAQKLFPSADYWVGLEGGVYEDKEGMGEVAWMYIMSQDGRIGKGRTGTFFVPPAAVDLIYQGHELGTVGDILFGTSNGKQKDGFVGALTKNLITRVVLYEHALLLALIPFMQPHLYQAPVAKQRKLDSRSKRG